MQKVNINKITEEIQKVIEGLAFNGLNLISNENIRQIEFFLQNASQVEAYRLATSLRYLNVEMKRFMEQSPAFNIDRYVFFLTNCWLLSRAFNFRKNTQDDEFYEILMGTAPVFVVMKKLKLRMVGIEKIFKEGSIFGVILYFVSLVGKEKGKILKWNVLQPTKGAVNPEILLTSEIPNLGLIYKELLPQTITASNLSYSERDKLITLGKEKVSINHIPNEKFSINILKQYDYDVEEIYNKISQFKHDPFEIPTLSFDYLLVNNVEVLDTYVEKDKKDDNSISVNIFKINHDKGYPLHIRIQDKPFNQALIQKFKEFLEKRKKIEHVFGRLVIERGQLSVFPLSIINKKELNFICLSDVHQDYREIMKTLYKK